MFRCKEFSDLPLTNWDYNCLAIQQGGGICVFLYQYLGGNTMFFRGTNSGGWDTAGWKEIAFTDDITTQVETYSVDANGNAGPIESPSKIVSIMPTTSVHINSIFVNDYGILYVKTATTSGSVKLQVTRHT